MKRYQVFLSLIQIVWLGTVSAQKQNEILSIYPKANQLNVSLKSEIVVTIHTPISLLRYNEKELFNVQGTNSGIISGKINIDTYYNQFIFKPDKNYFPGEIVYVGFGTLLNGIKDTTKTLHWQFTAQVPTRTTAVFDTVKKTNINTGENSFMIDINHDGLLDIINQEGILYLNKCKYQFETKKIVTNKESVKGIRKFSDLNRDGKIDFVGLTARNTWGVFLGTTDTSFLFKQDLLQNVGAIISLGDFNGDNYDDLLCFHYNTLDSIYYISVAYNDRNADFVNYATVLKIKGINEFSYLSDISNVDIDNDGLSDLVIGYVPRQELNFLAFQVYKNEDEFKYKLISEVYREYGYIGRITVRPYTLIQDYNNDGYLDIGIERNTGNIFYNNKKGQFSNAASFTWGTSWNPGYTHHGDLNGDGLFDLASSSLIPAPNEINAEVYQDVLVNKGSTFSTSSSTLVSTLNNYYPRGRLLVGDIDNDGDCDIINCGNPTYIALNTIKSTGISSLAKVPEDFLSLNNYPNPFNSETTIKYSLPKSGFVNISIFNVLGQEIQKKSNEFKAQGEYKFYLNLNKYPSGIYFCRITFENNSRTIKLNFLK